MAEHRTVAADTATQDPEELQVDTAHADPPAAGTAGLDERQRRLLFRLLRVAYPHDRFPDGPYERTATQVEAAAAGTADGVTALAAGLNGLGDAFAGLDEAAATVALQQVEHEPFFRQIHSTTVVALYDDREVWQLLGYEGPSFDRGGYIERGFDDLDWLPDPRITELDEPRTELVTDDGGRT